MPDRPYVKVPDKCYAHVLLLCETEFWAAGQAMALTMTQLTVARMGRPDHVAHMTLP